MLTAHMILVLVFIGFMVTVGWKIALISLKGFVILAFVAYAADWLIKHNLIHL